jgi:hypothetical protein
MLVLYGKMIVKNARSPAWILYSLLVSNRFLIYNKKANRLIVISTYIFAGARISYPNLQPDVLMINGRMIYIDAIGKT